MKVASSVTTASIWWLNPSSTSNDRHSSTDRYSQYPHARLPSGPVISSKVLADGRERHVVAVREFGDGGFAGQGAPEDVPPGRVGQGPEDPVHLVVAVVRTAGVHLECPI